MTDYGQPFKGTYHDSLCRRPYDQSLFEQKLVKVEKPADPPELDRLKRKFQGNAILDAVALEEFKAFEFVLGALRAAAENEEDIEVQGRYNWRTHTADTIVIEVRGNTVYTFEVKPLGSWRSSFGHDNFVLKEGRKFPE